MNLDGLSKLASSPWGYVVAAVLLLLLWEGGKRWLPALIEWLARRIRDALAGTRLMHGRSLRTYRQRVASRYARLPVLFMPGKGLDAATVYVPLRAIEEGESQPGDAHEAIKANLHAIVLGRPGAGKTMLLRHSMLTWAQDPTWRRGHRVPVLFELHRCGGNETTLEDHIVAQFSEDGFPKAARFAAKALADGQLSLLFDGLDEVSSAERDRVVQLLRAFAARYPKCQIVVTCRTAIYHRQLAPEITTLFQVAEFEDRHIRRFLRQWPAIADKTAVDRLLAALTDAPRIMQLARNPLLLTMIAYLYGTRPNRVLPHSRAEFYHEATDILLDRLKDNRNTFPAPVKKAVLKRLALTAQNTAGDAADRRTISYEDVRAEILAMGSNLGIEPAAVNPLLDEIVDRSGLLLRVDGGSRYQFAHLSLQEYLAAVAHEQDRDALLTRYRAAPDDWREVVKLWCGAVSADSGPLIDEVFALDPILAFECLADAHSVDDTVAERITSHFLRLLLEPDSSVSAAVTSAFGLVAADPRPRGRQVFDFLTAAANAGKEPGYAALAATKLPEAAATLVAQIESPAARSALITMGNLAVPALADAALRRHPTGMHVIDVLGAIATSTAAACLTETLWTEEGECLRAAWHLAALLADPEVEATLAEVDVPDQPSTHTWVCAPFWPDQSSSIARIAARIAELCDREGLENIPDTVQRIDPRIGIPLLVFGSESSFQKYVRRIRVYAFGALREWSYHADSGQVPDESVKAVEDAVQVANLLRSQHLLYKSLDLITRASLVARLAGGRLVTYRDWAQVHSGSIQYEFHRGVHFWLAVWLVVGAEIVTVAGSLVLLFTDWPWGPDLAGWVLVGANIIYTLVIVADTVGDGGGIDALPDLFFGYAIWDVFRDGISDQDWGYNAIFLVGSPVSTVLPLVVGVHYFGWLATVVVIALVACCAGGLTRYGWSKEWAARDPFRGLLELDSSAARWRGSVIAG